MLRSPCQTLCIWMESLLTPEWMGFQETWCWAALAAIFALEWLLSWVDPLMVFQISWCWAALVTVCAFEWLLSPLLVLSCSFKWPVIEKILLYIEHLKGFSLMWVLSCSFKELNIEKHLSHFVQWYGYSPILQFYVKFESQDISILPSSLSLRHWGSPMRSIM